MPSREALSAYQPALFSWEMQKFGWVMLVIVFPNACSPARIKPFPLFCCAYLATPATLPSRGIPRFSLAILQPGRWMQIRLEHFSPVQWFLTKWSSRWSCSWLWQTKIKSEREVLVFGCVCQCSGSVSSLRGQNPDILTCAGNSLARPGEMSQRTTTPNDSVPFCRLCSVNLLAVRVPLRTSWIIRGCRWKCVAFSCLILFDFMLRTLSYLSQRWAYILCIYIWHIGFEFPLPNTLARAWYKAGFDQKIVRQSPPGPYILYKKNIFSLKKCTWADLKTSLYIFSTGLVRTCLA
jgi:hypothetical protein